MTPEEYERLRRAELQQNAANNVAMQGRNPAVVARAAQIARKYGVAPALVEAAPDTFEKQERRDQAAEVIADQPWMSSFFSREPDIAAMFGEELPKASVITGILQGAARQSTPGQRISQPQSFNLLPSRTGPTLPRAPKRVAWTAKDYITKGGPALIGVLGTGVINTAAGATGAVEAAVDVAGFSEETDAYFRKQEEITAQSLANMRGDWADSGWQADVFSGAASTVQMLLPLPLGKKAILGSLVGATAGSAYTKYQGRDAGVGASLLGAGAEGTIEYLTERSPIGYLTGGMLKGSVKDFFGKYVLKDIIGEQIATAGQDAVDTAIANPDKSWADYWQERPDRAVSTLISTLTTSALVGGGGAVYRRFSSTVDDARTGVEGLTGQAILDEIMKNAETVEMRKAAPDDFARFVNEGAKDSPVKNVYIPIEAIDIALADETLPDEERAALTLYQSQIDEARVTNGDVVIPIGEVAARLAGTKVWQSLREDARVLAGGVSGKEAREKMDGLIAELESIGTAAIDEAKALTPSIEAKIGVYNEVKAQMLAAKRSEKEAQTTALLFASRAENLASPRYGQFKDAGEAWKWMQVEIKGAQAKAKKGGKKVAQNTANPIQFADAITAAKKVLGPKGSSVHVYTPEEYAGMRLFLSEDGKSGYAIKEDGDLVSVFSSEKGRGKALLDDAIEAGATKLDAFEGYLTKLYAEKGFRETGRDKWDDQYAPKGWNYDKFGRPDVVYMQRLPTPPAVLYHGTPYAFDKFKSNGKAIWFTESPEQAAQYASARRVRKSSGDQIIPVKADIRNPLHIDRGVENMVEDPVGWARDHFGFDLKAHGWEMTGAVDTHTITRSQAFGQAAREAGFDAIAIREGNTMTWGVLNPDTVISAISPSLTLYQSGVPLLDNPLTIEGKVTIKAVGEALTAHHMATEGRQFFPEKDEADYNLVLEALRDEMRAQLEHPNSGVGWYSADVEKAIEMAARVYPSLRSNPDHRRLFLTFAGILSNGNTPEQAFMISGEAFEAFLASGTVPVKRSDAARARGVEVAIAKTGKDVGWSVRNAANEQQFALINFLTEREGSLGAALEWFITPQPRSAINEAMLSSGLWKAGRFTTKAEIAGEDTPGYLAFGPKLGRYTMGLQGYDIDAGDVTIDMWYTRSYRRHVGRLMEGPLGEGGVVGGPTENDRRVIFRLTGDLAKEFNLRPGDAQAVLWFWEKRLWGAQGVNTSEGTNSSGAAKLLQSKGIQLNDGAGGNGESGGTVPLLPEDENGFPLEDVLSSVGDGLTDPMTLQQFGGARAAHFSPEISSNMSKAMLMERDDFSAEAIWATTGWMRGADGKWRFEISDDAAKLVDMPSPDPVHFDEVTPGIDYDYGFSMGASDSDGALLLIGKPLSEVMHHPELYKHYPKLARIPVFVDGRLHKNELGYYDFNNIVLNPASPPAEQLSTLLHEIQHAIQEIEGFANGSSPSIEILRAHGLGAELDREIEHVRAINNGEVPKTTYKRVLSEEEILATAAFNVYERVAGEVEARNTQFRAGASAAKRRQHFPETTAEFDRTAVLFPQVEQRLAASSTTGPVGPRGEATFFPDGRTVIQLFGRADFSTMLHEMSHVFLQQEFTLAKAKGASPELKADIERLTKWFKAHGGALDANGMPDVAAHELFARTGERYFREGKAPSPELRVAFKQFADWLGNIYKQVKDLLAYGPAPITPEIREIMDRMIATGEAIEANASTAMSQEELGMTAAEYEAYLDSVQGAQDAAHDDLLERMMKAIRRREQGRYREQRANIRAEVAEEVNADPRFVALHLLRTGRWLGQPEREAMPVKINTGWLIDNYGEEILQLLPVGLQPLHRGDGVIGDDVAQMVGMPSGDALVQALVDLKQQADQLKADGNPRPLRDQLIEEQTDAIMADRHGDIALSEEQIEEEAIAALNSARQGEVLATELRQLKKVKGAGGAVTPYQILREWARRKVNEGTVGDAVSKSALQRYIRGYNKARNLFEQAILGQDNVEAIKQKQAQMINHALLAEGKVVADEINTIVRRMQRYAKTKALASIDQDYMDRIHELLEGYSFREVSNRARADQASFEEWAAGQRAAGHEVHVPERFRDNRTNWKDAQVAKLLELNDMVQSLAAQGKLKQRLTSAREERELQAEIDDVESRILSLPVRKMPETSTGEDSSMARAAASELVKLEGAFDILDGGKDATGPLNRWLMQGATDAANAFSRLMEEVMDPIIAIYRGMSRKQTKRLHDRVTINELTLNVSIHAADTTRLGQPLTITRMQLLGLIANTGNLSNLSKLVGGERWGDPESATDMARVRDILVSYASKEDMDLVQSMWNGVAKLWPHIARVERELSGVVPEEVVTTPFETPYGPYSGGYWPVVWDSSRSTMGQKQGEEAESSLQGIGFSIGTPKGHTITRTGAMAPMEWSIERVLFSHMTKVVSRVAYAPWVRNALKIVDNRRISGAIDLRLGAEYRKQIKPWIRDQIPSNIPDHGSAKWWEKLINGIRINFSIAVLGVSYSTGVAQTLGLGYSVGVLGEGSKTAGMRWMATGIGKMLQLQKDGVLQEHSWRGLRGAQAFVFARSEEMQRRAREVNQEAIDVFNKLKDSDTLYRRAQAAAFWHIGFIDLNMVAIPTWMGGFHKGLSEGLNEQQASAYADKMVRLSQSSGRKKDLSAIQRGHAAEKLIAMFYTPSSVFFNQQWEAVQHMKAGNWSKALAPTFYFLVLTTIMDAMREGDWPEDDEEDGLGGVDIIEWVGRNLLFGAFYGVPLVRDATNAAERKLRGEFAEYGNTPISALAQTTERGAHSAIKVVDPDEDIEGKDIKNMVAATGFLFGLPGNQPGKTLGYGYDVAVGNADPQNVNDWYQGITSGKQPEPTE